MSRKGEFIVELKANELGLKIEDLADEATAQLEKAIGDLAHATHAMILAKAQAELDSTRQDYVKGLSLEKIGESTYVILLEGDYANKLESGYPAFDMKPGMLKSQKIVDIGRRTGEPWVQRAKEDGHKFAYVPLERKPMSKAPKARDMADAIKQMTAYNRHGRKQKITSLFKDEAGKPMQGLVAIAKDTGIKDLESLVKYQYNEVTKSGKTRTKSVYINYRIVSEAQGDSWMHPGFPGLKAFEDAERFVETELDEILKGIL